MRLKQDCFKAVVDCIDKHEILKLRFESHIGLCYEDDYFRIDDIIKELSPNFEEDEILSTLFYMGKNNLFEAIFLDDEVDEVKTKRIAGVYRITHEGYSLCDSIE